MIKIEQLEKRIKDANLTKTEKKIADYFLENINHACLKTASDIALEIGVSDTSIIRFVRSMGYTGYSEFQRAAKEDMMQKMKDSDMKSSLANRYKKSIDSMQEDSLITHLVNQTYENIRKTMNRLNQNDINRIVDILINSNVKYVIGFRGSASLCSFLASKLRYILPNVRTYTRADSECIEGIVDITEKDCILIYSFPMYSEMCISAVDIAHGKNAKIISITDTLTSPIAAKADIVLQAKVSEIGFYNSYIAPMCLTDLILLSVSNRIKSDANERIDLLESYIDKHGLH